MSRLRHRLLPRSRQRVRVNANTREMLVRIAGICVRGARLLGANPTVRMTGGVVPTIVPPITEENTSAAIVITTTRSLRFGLAGVRAIVMALQGTAFRCSIFP